MRDSRRRSNATGAGNGAEREVWQSVGPDAVFARRDEFLLHVGEEPARFLHALAAARRAKRILELGTSYGYSTLFLADAARTTGGTLVTLELNAGKQAHAKQEIEAAGLGDHVEFHCGDAVALLPTIDGPFDFVLVDLWKDLYVPCLELFYPKLAENAVIAADNMLQPTAARPDCRSLPGSGARQAGHGNRVAADRPGHRAPRACGAGPRHEGAAMRMSA